MARAASPERSEPRPAAIPRAGREGPLPLSFAQQRLWFLEQLGGLGSTYHVPMRLRLRGALDRAALGRALDRIVARHESLRTTFAQVDGVPEQRIAPADAGFHLVEHDLGGAADADAALARLIADEAEAPFDLARGPLVRGRLVRVAEDHHVLLMTLHHIVSDGWSGGVLTRELRALYDAFRRGEPDPLPALEIQYPDFAVWQRRWVEGEVLQAQADYWKRTMAGAPELLELPTDRPRPAERDAAGAVLGFELDAELTAGLKALSRRHGTTMFMTVLAAWAVVLGRLSGQSDVVVGSPMAGRGRQETEGLIGFFVNTLALRMDLSGSPTVAELLARVKERTLAAQQHQDIPFEQVVELVAPARSRSHTPLFQALFAWQNTPREQGGARSGLRMESLSAGAADARAKFDLSLAMREADDRIAAGISYAVALWDRETVARWAGYLRRVLEAMVADDGQRVERMALLSADEHEQVVRAWNRTDAEIPSASTVHALFERQAERAPEATAVVFDGGRRSYGELNARANRLAHHLRSLGVGPDVRVALAMPRSPELVEAELAVLKCGGAYVPMDPGHPAERLREMLADSAPAAVLTVDELAARFADVGVPVLAVDGDDSAWASLPATNVHVPGLTPDHLAYVMYTSGSTGRPKGVMVSHRAIVRLVVANGYADFGPDDRVAFAANPAFDATTMEVWAPLVNGGTVAVIGQDTLLDARAFANALRTHQVTVLWLTAALLNHYAPALGDVLGRLRYLIVGGEALDPGVIAGVLRDCPPAHLLNGYGPTETTTFAVTHRVTDVPAGARTVPLGRPIGNTRVYVLDPTGAPVPVGVAGEMYIGGLGVARGYQGRPALTAERFVPDAFGTSPGARLYRTGDVARWLADGTLEFLGRTDHQVKVRGFRIEPGEIEARLLEHPGVREAVVLAREDAPGERRLVAYVVADEDAGADGLRAHLGERLPAYMVPAAFVRLDAFPLTPNGKVDRRALPAPEGDAFARRGHAAPVGETETALAGIWSDVLGLERVGRWDDFFDLGGHSLLAVQVISRVRQALAAEVALGELFTRPVLADFARALDDAARAELPPIHPAPRDERIPLSFAQQRLWLLEQLATLGSTYHIPGRLRLQGALDRPALRRALDAIVARHEALRTTFTEVDGVPEQRIAPADAGFPLGEDDLEGRGDAALQALMAAEVRAPFDLERGPLLRGRLVRLADDDHVLLLTMHHIVSDGWSMGVLTRELSALYTAFREGRDAGLPALPVQYADYAAWQRRWVEGDVLRAQADYWRQALGGAPGLLELPTDRPRPAQMDHAGARLEVELDAELTAGLRALSRRHGTTLFMTLLAGWAVVLGRLSGQTDVVVGTPVANRGRREIEGLIGFFVNTLALRMDLSGSPTVADLLGRARDRALQGQHHQDIPFEQVVELLDPVRSLSHSPLFQVMFTWQEAAGRPGFSLPGLRVGGVGAESAPVQAKFDLSLSLRETGDRIAGSVTYATSLFHRETVERFVGYLRAVLAQVAADDAQPVDRLSLLPPAERARVVEEWNRTDAGYPAHACVHELFESQVRRTPDAVALVAEGQAPLSYAELNARANRLAHHLRSRGVGPDVCVGLCLERGAEMVVALLAVLKAGGAYVPLDPEYPADRLAYMVADAAPAVVLTQSSLADLFADAAIPLIRIDSDAARWADAAATDPARGALTPDHLAYVIYTSGSTGRPKGVMNQHRALVNRLDWGRRDWSMDGDEALLCKTSLNFDGSLREILLPLISGGRVVVARPGGHRDPSYLLEAIGREGITTVNLVPSLLQVLLDAPEVENLRGLRRILCGGEALPGALLERCRAALPDVEIHNLYGPSEAATAVTAPRLSADPSRAAVPIGGPSANARVYVLDGAGEPVPVGVAGELYVGGVPVARGYLGRAALTAERFVPDAFGGEPGARLYRTGDVVRWMGDGRLDFVGRNDDQVKVRGFRVEPGEIEARLREHADVRDAVVLVREDVPGDRRLVAYHVGDRGIGIEALRAHLADRLPEYMVPAAYVRLDALPLTPSGKLDRRALPAPEGDAYAAQAYAPPVGETEEALAEIWAEVLRAERVGRHDSFFALGGHSLLAVQVISRVRRVLRVEAALGDIFARPVLADFARGLRTAEASDLPPIQPAPRDGRIPLSFAQQRLWFLAQLRDLGSTYHIFRATRLRGELDRGALVRALDRIVARHEALRTTFAEVDGVPEQRIAPADAGFHLVEHDLSGDADAQAELERLTAEEAHAPFHLERGPLIRGRLVRMGADDHVLLLAMHHIVSDAWSMGVFFRELSAFYGADRAGGDAALPLPPVQYADYAAWQRRWVEGDVLQAQAEYWTRTLGDAPELLELPTDRPRPAQMDPSAAHVPVELDAELTAALKALSRRTGTTLFMTLVAGWAAVLARLSGQDDVVVGTPTAGRGRHEIEGLIGFFVNTLALRVDLSGSPTVVDLLGRVRDRALEAQQHQDIPFEQVVERVDPVRSLSHTPLFQVLFAWQDAAEGRGLSLPGLETGRAAAVTSQAQANRDLSLSLREANGRIVGSVAYATALFDAASVERWVGYLRRALREMAADEHRPVDRLAILPADERARVLDAWNRTDAEYPADRCIHELIQAQAARTPDATAVVFDGGELSYDALNAAANRLAHALRARGVGPDARVAVCLERGRETMVALLAVLKAGGAYVPLDPEYPAERLACMLADSAPVVVLTQSSLAPLFAGAAVPHVRVDGDAAQWADRPATNPARGALTPENLAYVIYTSGSTGTPKGVGVPHRAVGSQLAWAQRNWALRPDEAVLQRISLSFDVSVRELFWPLTVGARVVMAPADRGDPDVLVDTLAREGIGAVHMVPSLLQPLLEHPRLGECTRLTRVLCGGEVLSPALARRFHERLPGASLNHMYGPTETTVGVTAARCQASPPDGRLPLGRPLANTRAYVLDARGEPVPVGAAGELHVGGAQVARGYLDRPAQTAERFVPDPFSGRTGARMYRTGDRVRWLPQGELEFLGRVDHQVKVRGFRIELGEIEARLAEHPAVREAVVLVREDAPGSARLVAYVAAEESAGADVLRAHLADSLPEYMVPAAYVRLDAFPLTPNGKVDRRALPAPDGAAFAARAYEPPAGDTEQALADVWAEVLGVERVGRRDHFFELGGHSLLAVQVVSRVRHVLGVDVALGEVFAHPVLADLAGALETAARTELPPIGRAPRDGRLPLSFAQQRLWFLEQLGNLGTAYHMRIRLRLRGALDRPALVRALDDVVERHESLRTTFALVDGAPEQRIAPAEASGFHLVEHDLEGRADAPAELARIVGAEEGTAFDLERGPLIRGRLVRLAADDHVLVVTMHHIVSDGWSMGVLTHEISALYAARRQGTEPALPALPVQYADYAAWQRRWVEGDVLRAQADYWARTLGGAPALLELPTDRPRPAQTDPAGALLPVALDEALTAELKALSRRHGTTLFMTLLAGWAAVLSRLSGQDDVVVGTPTAGRARREVEGLIGFFVNTLAVRVDLSGAPTAAELLARVRARVLDAQHHQDIPFEQVVERVDPARSLSHTPLFQALFAWQNTPRAGLELPGLRLGRVDAPGDRDTVKQDLGLTLGESGGRITGAVTYATALFDRATVERHVEYLRRVLAEMAADEHRPVRRLPLVPAEERARVLEAWNRTEAAYPDACVHELFQAQAARTPGATAVLFEGERVAYAELNARANRLAHHLRGLGVGPDARVALCVERGVDMVVGMLAVLKAGGAYVPLDPAYPADRLAHVLADSAPAAVLTQGHLRARVGGTDAPVLELDAAAPPWADAPASDPPRGAMSPARLAYVIYTSGSTGRPKGVAVPHGGVVNLLAAIRGTVGMEPGDRVLAVTTYAFDISVLEIFLPLLHGAEVVVLPRERAADPEALADAVRAHAPTLMQATPATWRMLVQGGWAGAPGMRALCGGEALPAELASALRGRVAGLWNVYGPTETTIWSTVHPVGGGEGEAAGAAVRIGRPVANTRVYLLDDDGQPVPLGAAGELCIGGAGVVRGYLGRPELTAERFVADPFGGEPGARLYRTGDLARWRADGTLEFLGRTDFQVKVRGFRIEPGEIEARLAEHPAVRQAVVMARDDASGEKALVAYVVGGDEAQAQALRAHLAETLPEHMVPAAYVRLDALPLTPNGKLDRGALPAPDGDAFARGGYEAPATEAEAAVARLWAEVLGVERVGRHDGFFALGGHSLLAVTLLERMRRQGLHADLRALFAAPTLAEFAASLGSAPRAVAVPDNLITRRANSAADAEAEDVEVFL